MRHPNVSGLYSHRVGLARGHVPARRQVFPLEEVIHLELHQDLRPEVRAVRPVGGERFLGAVPQSLERGGGQRGAELGVRRISFLLEEGIEILQPEAKRALDDLCLGQLAVPLHEEASSGFLQLLEQLCAEVSADMLARSCFTQISIFHI
jgi:hypothetical protein